MQGILIIANLDAGGAESAEFKDLIGQQGFSPLLMDVSTERVREDHRCARSAALDEARVEVLWPEAGRPLPTAPPSPT